MIYTIGYQKTKINVFLDKLQSNGIKKVVDVRILPLSRVKGYSKSSLADLLPKNGIEYLHLPSLGTPKEMLAKYRINKDYTSFFAEFREYLFPMLNNGLAVRMKDIFSDNETSPTCLLCYEKNPLECHRLIIAEAFELKFKWKVQHL